MSSSWSVLSPAYSSSIWPTNRHQRSIWHLELIPITDCYRPVVSEFGYKREKLEGPGPNIFKTTQCCGSIFYLQLTPSSSDDTVIMSSFSFSFI
ncbi:hypothetical protein Celaphus_00002093 [Cervus elaphus hippelaphus]|uniref:Uncharacterized protein n=1 Tax=Cervus elaphus hippelaphus TaxID=46360 RepID=A0A212CEZ1_CEREH|nr:hypothetical protein Celaphus_00002093 [Cervus elaphus hippelaphus]